MTPRGRSTRRATSPIESAWSVRTSACGGRLIPDQCDGRAGNSPLPIAILNGTADPMVPYDTDEIRVRRRARGVVLSTDETVALGRARNGCARRGRREGRAHRLCRRRHACPEVHLERVQRCASGLLPHRRQRSQLAVMQPLPAGIRDRRGESRLSRGGGDVAVLRGSRLRGEVTVGPALTSCSAASTAPRRSRDPDTRGSAGERRIRRSPYRARSPRWSVFEQPRLLGRGALRLLPEVRAPLALAEQCKVIKRMSVRVDHHGVRGFEAQEPKAGH